MSLPEDKEHSLRVSSPPSPKLSDCSLHHPLKPSVFPSGCVAHSREKPGRRRGRGEGEREKSARMRKDALLFLPCTSSLPALVFTLHTPESKNPREKRSQSFLIVSRYNVFRINTGGRLAAAPHAPGPTMMRQPGCCAENVTLFSGPGLSWGAPIPPPPLPNPQRQK